MNDELVSEGNTTFRAKRQPGFTYAFGFLYAAYIISVWVILSVWGAESLSWKHLRRTFLIWYKILSFDASDSGKRVLCYYILFIRYARTLAFNLIWYVQEAFRSLSPWGLSLVLITVHLWGVFINGFLIKIAHLETKKSPFIWKIAPFGALNGRIIRIL